MNRSCIALAVILLIAGVPTVGSAQGDETGCGDQDDGGSGGDAPPPGDGDPVALGSGTVTGCLDKEDWADLYQAHLERGDRLQIEITKETCQRLEGSTELEVALRSPRGQDLSCESDDADRLQYVAETSVAVDVQVAAQYQEGAVNYTLEVQRDMVDLPDPHVAAIDDGVILEADSPAGEIPLFNLVGDTRPYEPDRRRTVSVMIGNDGNAATYRPVEVDLYAVPEDCAFDDTPLPSGIVERGRCHAERILSGTATDLGVGQSVEFQAQWDTTTTAGDQRLVARLYTLGGPDLDRSNNDLTEETPVVVGTEKGFN